MRILRFLPPILFGVVIGAIIAWIITKDENYAVVFGVGLGPAILISVMIGARGRGYGVKDSGGYAAGRVESVQRVGAAADGRQQADVRVSVFTQDDSPYQTTMRTTVDDAALRSIVAGSFIPLMRLGPRVRPDVSYAPTAPPEWTEQMDKLKAEASTLPVAADVKSWETATTTTPGTPKPGTRGRAGWISVALAVVAATATLVPAFPTIARGINNIVQGRWDGSNMVTGLYQQEAVDQMIGAAGTTQFTNFAFFDEFVIGDALSQTGPDRTDSITWRFGRAWVDGPSTSQSSQVREALFDASALDISKVAQVAQDAIQRSGIQDPDSVYAFIRVDTSIGEPVISISISGPYEDGYLDYSVAGEIISATGSAFE